MKKNLCVEKLFTIFIIFTMSILSVDAATTQDINNTVTVQRGHSVTKNHTYNNNIKTYNISTPKITTQSSSKKQTKCTPCQSKEVFFEKRSCTGNTPCTRTGFARPQNRLAVPYKRFAQPNKRLAQPKVRCNYEKRARNYYSGGMPKGGMTKRYGSNNKHNKTMPKIGMTKRYSSTMTKKKIPEMSRFDKNFSVKKASRPSSCKGITYYGGSYICK